MNLTMPYLESLRNFLFRRKLNAALSSTPRDLPENHFQNIRSIGVVFHATELKVREIAMELEQKLKDAGKRPKLLGYFNQDLEGLSFPFHYFTVKDLYFYFIPKSKDVEHFVNEKFDILINLDLEQTDPILYVCAISNARFKAGPANAPPEIFDLMVDPKTPMDFEGYLEEIRKTFNRLY